MAEKREMCKCTNCGNEAEMVANRRIEFVPLGAK